MAAKGGHMDFMDLLKLFLERMKENYFMWPCLFVNENRSVVSDDWVQTGFHNVSIYTSNLPLPPTPTPTKKLLIMFLAPPPPTRPLDPLLTCGALFRCISNILRTTLAESQILWSLCLMRPRKLSFLVITSKEPLLKQMVQLVSVAWKHPIGCRLFLHLMCKNKGLCGEQY